MQTYEENKGSIPSPLAAGFATARDKISETNFAGVVATVVVCTGGENLCPVKKSPSLCTIYAPGRPRLLRSLRSKAADG
jgi:hypothetical protein